MTCNLGEGKEVTSVGSAITADGQTVPDLGNEQFWPLSRLQSISRVPSSALVWQIDGDEESCTIVQCDNQWRLHHMPVH